MALFFLFIGLAVTATVCAVTRNYRNLVISTIGVHLFLGGLSLQLGAEFFSVLCILSGFTLSFSMTLFGASFGELIASDLGSNAASAGPRPFFRRVATFLPATSVFVASGAAWLLTLALFAASKGQRVTSEVLGTPEGRKFFLLGERILGAPFLPTLVIGIAAFTCVIGVGAVTRPRVLRKGIPNEKESQL
jgi:hypothetical protein